MFIQGSCQNTKNKLGVKKLYYPSEGFDRALSRVKNQMLPNNKIKT